MSTSGQRFQSPAGVFRRKTDIINVGTFGTCTHCKICQICHTENLVKSSDKLYNIFKKQSKNKKRIDDIREELKSPTYILKSESKDIKRNLYNIEKQKKLVQKKLVNIWMI